MLTDTELQRMLEIAEQISKARDYARKCIESHNTIRRIESEMDSYETDERGLIIEFDSWNKLYDGLRKEGVALCMRVKHFFNIVYGKGNIFNETLKGTDWIEHWSKFTDYIKGVYSDLYYEMRTR